MNRSDVLFYGRQVSFEGQTGHIRIDKKYDRLDWTYIYQNYHVYIILFSLYFLFLFSFYFLFCYYYYIE